MKEAMKVLALDLGDVWIGSAISDSLGITAKPYKTVKASALIPFLQEVIPKEELTTIVLGYPKTMGGKESDQTRKVLATKKVLEAAFANINWVLWDERLSSKQASSTKKIKNKEDKILSHSIAAAIFLTSYLLLASQKNT